MNIFSSINVIVQGEMHLFDQTERCGSTSLVPGAHRRHSEIENVVYFVDAKKPG